MSSTHPSPPEHVTDSTDTALSSNAAPPGEAEMDIIFEILKNSRRRRVLRYFEEESGTITLSDLAESIAADENDISESGLSSKQRKRVYVGLYQCHLPKMDDAGIIDFNKARGTVELRPAADQLYPYLYLETEAARADDSADAGEAREVRSETEESAETITGALSTLTSGLF